MLRDIIDKLKAENFAQLKEIEASKEEIKVVKEENKVVKEEIKVVPEDDQAKTEAKNIVSPRPSATKVDQ